MFRFFIGVPVQDKRYKINRLTGQMNCAYSLFYVALTVVNASKDSRTMYCAGVLRFIYSLRISHSKM